MKAVIEHPTDNVVVTVYGRSCDAAVAVAKAFAARHPISEGTTIASGRHQMWTFHEGAWLRTRGKGWRIMLADWWLVRPKGTFEWARVAADRAHDAARKYAEAQASAWMTVFEVRRETETEVQEIRLADPDVWPARLPVTP